MFYSFCCFVFQFLLGVGAWGKSAYWNQRRPPSGKIIVFPCLYQSEWVEFSSPLRALVLFPHFDDSWSRISIHFYEEKKIFRLNGANRPDLNQGMRGKRCHNLVSEFLVWQQRNFPAKLTSTLLVVKSNQNPKNLCLSFCWTFHTNQILGRSKSHCSQRQSTIRKPKKING